MNGRQIQLQLPYAARFRARLTHGGGERLRRRKLSRPIDPKRPLHLVMRSEMARGALSLLHPKRRKKIEALVREAGVRFGVQIYEFANVGNHLHLLIKGKDRSSIQSFLRYLPGRIAMLTTGARKGRPLMKRFWDHLAFTRVVDWGKAFFRAERYVQQNQLEADREIPYFPRGKIKDPPIVLGLD